MKKVEKIKIKFLFSQNFTYMLLLILIINIRNIEDVIICILLF